MKYIFKFSIFFLITLLLVSCQEPKNYDYLMQHPERLQKELAYCEGSETPNCLVVKHAADDFSMLVNESHFNPEKFGLKIIQAQQALSQMNPSSAEYRQQMQKIKIFYAVVVVTMNGE